MAKSDYAVKQSLTKEGYKVYNEVLNKLQDGSDKSKLAANENAFIYARMAESWARIRNEYGDTAYTAKDFMAEHAVIAGGKIGQNSFNQPITDFKLNLDRTIPIITIKEKYKGMNWRDLRDNQLPNEVEEKILSPRNEKNEYIPYVNKRTGRKVIITKGSISHFKSDHTRDKESQKERQTTLHYEVIEAIPQVLETGIWIEQNQDYHGAAKMVHRVVGAVKIREKVFGVRILVKKEKNKYKVEKGEYTQYRASDLTIKKESTLSSTSGNAPTNRSANRPILNTDSFEVSIRDLLKHVNDNLNLPYINPDGTPNYGIYLGDHETGGVMFITPNKHKKITDWYTANGVQFPVSESYHIDDYFDYSIADENDLRNAKEGKALNTLQNNTTFDNAHSKGIYT